MTPSEAREQLSNRLDWVRMECIGCIRKPCKHDREQEARVARQSWEFEQLDALTDDDLAWLLDRGWIPPAWVL